MEYDEFNEERATDEEGLSEEQLANIMYTDTRPLVWDYTMEGENGDQETLGLQLL